MSSFCKFLFIVEPSSSIFDGGHFSFLKSESVPNPKVLVGVCLARGQKVGGVRVGHEPSHQFLMSGGYEVCFYESFAGCVGLGTVNNPTNHGGL